MQLAPMPTVINRIVNIPSIAPFNLSLLERFPRGAHLPFWISIQDRRGTPRDHIAPDQPVHKFMVFFR